VTYLVGDSIVDNNDGTYNTANHLALALRQLAISEYSPSRSSQARAEQHSRKGTRTPDEVDVGPYLPSDWTLKADNKGI
jgi:hypothetical protein